MFFRCAGVDAEGATGLDDWHRGPYARGGRLMGKHALAPDNLLSVDLVLPDGRFLTATKDDNARSLRRRYSIPTDAPRATLQRSIGLFDRGDEDFGARLEIALVPLHVNNNGRTGGDKDFLFSVLVFQRQRLPINRGDNPWQAVPG